MGLYRDEGLGFIAIKGYGGFTRAHKVILAMLISQVPQ